MRYKQLLEKERGGALQWQRYEPTHAPLVVAVRIALRAEGLILRRWKARDAKGAVRMTACGGSANRSTPPTPVTPIRDEDKKPVDPKSAVPAPNKNP